MLVSKCLSESFKVDRVEESIHGNTPCIHLYKREQTMTYMHIFVIQAFVIDILEERI